MGDSSGDPQRLLADALRAVQALRKKVEALEAARTMPIAVVGAGCRFPGEVYSPRDYWALLENGVDTVSEIPAHRWRNKDGETGLVSPTWGAFLKDVDGFDPTFFRIAPREAMYLDPQQRLLLEVAWEALEDAAISPHVLHGSDTGVFIGIASFDYGLLMASRLSEAQIDPSSTTGIFHSPAAGRLSYVLGLRGPSLAVDTACSSSLVAIHLACESLRRGECSVALVGGVNLILAPFNHISTGRAQMLSPEGRCKTFSEGANGYGRGEGCGMVVLKRLSDALAAKDRILAVIRGSAVNQDGASGGLTVPSGPAQQEVIRKALAEAGIDSAAVDYVEAHGTGTALGDPIEVNALGEVFAKTRDAARPLWIGSCKTNIGHLEPAAGIGGFLKAILQLHHGAIAPSLHFDHPSSHIAWNELPFSVPTQRIPWPSEGGKRRVAGVSSFGFSGTNAHIIVEEAPPTAAQTAAQTAAPKRSSARASNLFVLSARSKQALRDLVRAYVEFLERNPSLDLGDLCHSANAGRAHFEHRLAVIATSCTTIREKLQAFEKGELPVGAWHGTASADAPLVGFVFPAVGRWEAPALLALEASEAIFRETMDRLEAVVSKEAGWSLREIVGALDTRSERIEYALPIHYCFQVALVSLWRSWGVVPAHVFGHDTGEYAAAYAGGIFSAEDGLRLVLSRARYLQALEEKAAPETLAGLRSAIATVAAGIQYRAPELEIISSESRLSQPDSWANPSRDSWSLQRGIDALSAAGTNMAIEIGPACSDWAVCVERLASSYVAGQCVDWNGFTKNCWEKTLALPTYPFQRRSYWFPCKMAFVFSGQGSQWAGMGKTLLAQQPVFREAMEACDRAIHREAGFSILEEIEKNEDTSRLGETVVAQPALFAIEVALAALLKSWGVTPEMVIGHSVGEIAAAHVAGILALDDAARIVALRGRIMQKATGHGRMIAVELTENAALGMLRGFEARAGVAAVNDPGQVVISGDIEAIRAIVERLSSQEIQCREVPVEYAFHSPQMEPLRDEFVAALGKIAPRAGTIPMWSTVTGERVRGESLDGAYWGQNIRQTVRFSQAVNQCIAGGGQIFIEVGPHSVLSKNIEQILTSHGPGRQVIGTLRRHKDERAALHSTIDALAGHRGEPRLLAALARLAPTAGSRGDQGGGIVQDYYDSVTEMMFAANLDWREGNDGEIYLTFGPLREPLAGFSWFSTMSNPRAHEQHAHMVLKSQRHMREVLFRHVDFSSCHKVLDFGCGYASDLLTLAKKHPHLELHGYTISPEQAKTGQQRVRDGHLEGRVTIYNRDSARDAFPVACDLMFGFEVAHHIKEKAGLFSNIGSHLNPGGWLILADFISHLQSDIEHEETSSFFLIKESWVRHLSSQGLQLVDCVDISQEVANFLEDPEFDDLITEGKFAAVNQLFRAGMKSYDQLGKLLRRGLASYVLMTVRRVVDVAMDAIEAANRQALDVMIPYTDVDPARGEELLYTVSWERAPLASASAALPASNGAWLMFAPREEAGAALVSQWRARGERCVRVVPGERMARIDEDLYSLDPARPDDYRKFLAEAFGESMVCRGIVHLWSLDAAPLERTTPETLNTDVLRGSVSVTYLVNALGQQGWRDVPRLWLVTRGAVVTDRNGGSPAMAQAALWGLGRTIALEHPEFECTCVDLDPIHDVDNAALLVHELHAKSQETQITLRGDGRRVGRLSRGQFDDGGRTNHQVSTQTGIRADGSYLITGGLGGLGIVAAKWLVERGARHITLVGRNEPREDARQAIQWMQDRGARLSVARADISRMEEVASLLSTIEAHGIPLRGIIHAAGVVDDHLLPGLTEEHFRRVLAPKMHGAWNLHTLTQQEPLDFFVMYSSAATLLGSPGQGNYCVANAFLDALAGARVELGLPGMSIQWGSFSDVGMAAATDIRGKRLAYRGIGSIAPAQGMDMLGRLLDRPRPAMGVLSLDMRQWVEFYPRAAAIPFFSRLKRKAEETQTNTADALRIRNELEKASAADRPAIVEKYVAEELGRVVRLEPSEIHRGASFASFGVDSLMSLEFRNRLEACFGLQLPSTLLFTYPTMVKLTTHLVDKLGLSTLSAESPDVRSQDVESETNVRLVSQLDELESEMMLEKTLEEFKEYY